MKKLTVLFASILAACSVQAEVRYYTEYKNDVVFLNDNYVDNSARNMIRTGVEGSIFYFEAGPVTHNSDLGASYEVGYKYKLQDKWVFKGKLEGFQYDNYEGDTASKFETEVRYYFN